MSKLSLIHGSCADQTADAVVNATNSGLWDGSGICGVIFSKCGSKELAKECSKYQTPIKDGNAVITSACKMKNAKYIIHAVGPDYEVDVMLCAFKLNEFQDAQSALSAL